MSSFPFELDVESELSMSDIHQSIELSLNNIRERHEQVDAVLGDLPYLKRTTENVLIPINAKARIPRVATIAHLKMLLASCARPSPPSTASKKRVPTPPTKLRPFSRAKSDGRINLNEGKAVTLPPVKPKCFSATQCHTRLPGDENTSCEAVLLPININKAYRTVLHTKAASDMSDSISKTKLINARRERRLRRQKDVLPDEGLKNEAPDIKHFEMNRFLDDVEREMCVLQETFSAFTQKVLVPLQMFCKQGNISLLPVSKKDSTNNNDQSEADEAQIPKPSLDRTEFRIVQTMNQIRQLLWPTDNEGPPAGLYSEEHFSKKVASEVDCEKYPVVRLVPDILQKFNEVITLASMWLKRDAMYVQSAKSALQRAHRRFLKTERLWRQARDSQRHLRTEWENLFGELQNHTVRLHSVEDDVKILKEEMNKYRGVKKLLENKIKTTDENIDQLRAKHRALRKRVIVLSTKIEARERSHGFLESRVLSLKADQEAMSEKLRISEEYTSNLQKKMEELYGVRDAWSRRYEDKTDPDKLRSRLQQARLRMPLPCLREKTFILRTRMENLRDALDIVEQRLSDRDISWSTLCDELPWPGNETSPKLVRLPAIHSQRMKRSDGEESGGHSSSSPTDSDDSSGYRKAFSWRRAVAASKIKERVMSTHPHDESQQCSLMLHLWMEQNGKDATLEKLTQALRASNINSLADSVERHVT
ncbi:uncharacterized protein LOC120340864 [Styela clava]